MNELRIGNREIRVWEVLKHSSDMILVAELNLTSINAEGS